MASGSEMEVVLVAQVSSLVKGMQEGAAATQQLLNTIKQMSGGMAAVGQATKPANDAVKSFADTIKGYKADQTQQARTTSFFVRELTDITGMSREASSAVGGLGQVMLEAAAGGGALAIGFEAVKFAISQVVTEWRRAGEELKAVERIQQGVTNAMMAGKEALEKYSGAIKTAGDKAFADVLSAATESIKGVSKELDDLRAKGPGVLAYVRLAFKDTDMIDAFEERVRKASLAIEQIINRASNQADIARALVQEGQKAAQAPMADKVIANDEEKRREKAQADRKKAEADWMAIITNNAKVYYDELERREKELLAIAKQRMDDATSRGLTDALEPNEDTGQNISRPRSKLMVDVDKNAMEALQNFNAESQRTIDIYGAIGGAIGDAFSSIGKIVGGAAGAVLKVLGQMIQQAVQLAISLAMASMAWTTPLGMVAIGSIALAGILGLMAAVPSFDVGTMSVPKTGLAMVHQGEAILPADGTAQAYRAGGRNITVNISATDAASFEKMLRRNDNALVRVLRDATRAGRA